MMFLFERQAFVLVCMVSSSCGTLAVTELHAFSCNAVIQNVTRCVQLSFMSQQRVFLDLTCSFALHVIQLCFAVSADVEF